MFAEPEILLFRAIRRAPCYIIPRLCDQNSCAQSRIPMDMMRQGWSRSLFHASQQ
jgi:hypothetical protein